MTNRYFSFKELNSLFDKNLLPIDISSAQVVGVFEASECALLIENVKISGKLVNEIHQKFVNVDNSILKGLTWLIPLSSDKLSTILLNEDFVAEHCDKKSNPYELAKRMTLYYQENYSYWTENVYLEAFNE